MQSPKLLRRHTKKKSKSSSNTWLRPEFVHNRARAPRVCTRGGVAQAAVATCGKMAATKAAAKKAEHRVATACPRRLIILDCRLPRPTARPRLSSRAEPRGAMVGGVGEGTRGGQVVPGRVEGPRHTDWRETESTATRLVGSKHHCDAEVMRRTKTTHLGGRVGRNNSGCRHSSTHPLGCGSCCSRGTPGGESYERRGGGEWPIKRGTALVSSRQAHTVRGKGASYPTLAVVASTLPTQPDGLLRGGGGCHSPPLRPGCQQAPPAAASTWHSVRLQVQSVRPNGIVTYCIASGLGLPRWAADSTLTDRVG